MWLNVLIENILHRCHHERVAKRAHHVIQTLDNINLWHYRWYPVATGPLGPSTGMFDAVGSTPGKVWQTMATTDGLALPQAVPYFLYTIISNKY